MIKRLPSFAESIFASRCSSEGALCHPFEEDESGWDFLVEFPTDLASTSSDTAPPTKQAFVQVKSHRAPKLYCDLKLSNVFAAARSPQPWFIVLVVPGSEPDRVRYYCVHVWRDLMHRILKRVRQAAYENAPLNKKSLRIRFDPDQQRGEGVVRWIRDQLDRFGDYEEEKKQIYKTIGFEEGYGTVQVSFEDISWTDVIENFLGYGNDIQLTRFQFTPSRFGIHSPQPSIDIEGGTLQILQPANIECEVRVRGAILREPIVLRGFIYSPGIPDLPVERTQLRISADFMDLFWSPAGASRCSVQVGPDERKPLFSLLNYFRFMETIAFGAVEVQVWHASRRSIDLSITPNASRSAEPDWNLLAESMEILVRLAGRPRSGVLCVSLSEVQRVCGQLEFMKNPLAPPSFRIEFDASNDDSDHYESAIYYAAVVVGGLTFYALAERDVREDARFGNRRRLTCDQARIVEGYVLAAPDEPDRLSMQADYERHLRRRQESSSVLGLGDARELAGRTGP